MLALLLAVGLGVDISHFYLVKGELQNAADASALAGASALNSSASGIHQAVQRAEQQMNNFEFNKNGVSFKGKVFFANNLEGPYMDESTAATNPDGIRFVQVTSSPSSVGVSFASTIIGSQKSLAATATAGMSVPPNQFVGWIPLSVIEEAEMLPGTVYTIRAAPQNSVSDGNYQVLAVAGSGASDARVGIASGVNIPAGPGGVFAVDTKPGVNSGPVRAGINSRFDEYSSDLDPEQYPPDTNIKENISYDAYRAGTSVQPPSHTGVPGRRIVLIPIVKKSEYDQGRNVVTFNRFGAFFLRTKAGQGNGGDIQAEYIGDRIVIGGAMYNPGGGPGNPLLAFPVLYK
jgi:Flp pilus assembly protein TadG